MESIYDLIGPLPPPNSGDEANLTKWGWPSPSLLERHSKPKCIPQPVVKYDGKGECPF